MHLFYQRRLRKSVEMKNSDSMFISDILKQVDDTNRTEMSSQFDCSESVKLYRRR
jgi:hypothetical protein